MSDEDIQQTLRSIARAASATRRRRRPPRRRRSSSTASRPSAGASWSATTPSGSTSACGKRRNAPMSPSSTRALPPRSAGGWDDGLTSETARGPNLGAMPRHHRRCHPCTTLRDHAVDALGAVDGLGHAQVRGQAAERVGVLARQVPLFAEQHDHVAQRPDHALIEVGVHRHRHVVRRRLGAGIVEPQILAQRQPETSLAVRSRWR